ncbi:MAG: TetR/AcrR family transcriptional regulator [Candidatus Dormibacteria bacterium]
MSTTRGQATRHGVLEAAARLFLDRGYHGVGLEVVAEAAGVTRQTVYNLFGSKAGLLRALVSYVEERAGLPTLLTRVASAPDGRAMLQAMVDTAMVVEPLVSPYSRLVYAARVEDATAAELWKDRMAARRAGMGMVMARLAQDGALRDGVTADEAADVAASLVNPHHYEYLVMDHGWSPERYRKHLEETIQAVLLKPTA